MCNTANVSLHYVKQLPCGLAIQKNYKLVNLHTARMFNVAIMISDRLVSYFKYLKFTQADTTC